MSQVYHPDLISRGMLLAVGFIGLSVAMAAVLVFLAGRQAGARAAGAVALVAAAWLALAGGLAARGALAAFDRMPPAFMLLCLPGLGLVIALVLSPAGRAMSRASWWWLVGLQAFRIPVELLIHGAVEAGVAPPQLTWTGYNL